MRCIIWFEALDGFLGYDGALVDDRRDAETMTEAEAYAYCRECRDGSGPQVDAAIAGDEVA